jgi:hypothetical protein
MTNSDAKVKVPALTCRDVDHIKLLVTHAMVEIADMIQKRCTLLEKICGPDLTDSKHVAAEQVYNAGREHLERFTAILVKLNSAYDEKETEESKHLILLSDYNALANELGIDNTLPRSDIARRARDLMRSRDKLRIEYDELATAIEAEGLSHGGKIKYAHELVKCANKKSKKS